MKPESNGNQRGRWLLSNKKVALLVSACVVLVACAIGAWEFYAHTPAIVPTNPGWKVYENKEFGFSVEYPPTFAVNEKNAPQDNALTVAIVDPSTGFQIPISVWGKQSDVDSMNEYFLGPYPRQLPPSGNNSSRTVVERTLGGVNGVEYYGIGAEGTSFDDAFIYRGKYLFQVYLDPVIEGRITRYREPGSPLPTDAYKDAYERILASIRIEPTVGLPWVVDEKEALAELQNDLLSTSAHFIQGSEQGQVMSPLEAKIEADVGLVLRAQYAAAYPQNPPFPFLPGATYRIESVGKRYLLITQMGSDKSNGAVLDSQTGSITPVADNVPFYLTDDQSTALYIVAQSIYAYKLDQSAATLVPGSQLSGAETYHNGVGALGIVVQPEQTHTNADITISTFDSSKTLPNPDGGTRYVRLGQRTLTF